MKLKEEQSHRAVQGDNLFDNFFNVVIYRILNRQRFYLGADLTISEMQISMYIEN